MKPEIDTILLKVASRCNINCSYCYVFNMGDDNWSRLQKRISTETIDAFSASLKRLAIYQDSIFSIVLHGGEPLLLGPQGLEYLLRSLRKAVSPDYPIGIQTNGILLTPEILDICSVYRATVAISLDGPRETHDRYRLDKSGKGTFDRVLRGITLLQAHPDRHFLDTGLLAVIDPTSNPAEVYSFFKGLQTPSVDFIYRDGNHDRLPDGKKSLSSVEYGAWMAGLLDAYLFDPDPLPIRVLDDMMKVILGGLVSKEGVGVTDFGILVVDTDGTIMKNDTLKSSFNGADRFSRLANIRDECLVEFIQSPDYLAYKVMQRPTSDICMRCPDLHLCGGGMILHRWSQKEGFDNPSVYCADQRHLIEKMRHSILKLVTHDGRH